MGKTAKTQKTDRLHVTDLEVKKLIDATTATSRNPEHDRCLLLLIYRHGYLNLTNAFDQSERLYTPTYTGSGSPAAGNY